MTIFIIFFTKLLAKISTIFNLGSGSTWPGHIALKIDKNIIKKLLKKSSLQIIFVAGTNGKTTTSSLLKTIFEQDGKKVIQNNSGANLINGIASTLILHSNSLGKINGDYAVFEVDENVLPLALLEITPTYVIFLNLFRDQLDRYGEVRSIAKKWQGALKMLPSTTSLILNADDPQIAYLGKGCKGDVLYFGLTDTSLQTKIPQHAADSLYCPYCGHKLTYKSTYFSHLGDYRCANCKFTRPLIDQSKSYYPLSGVYNMYNTLAAVLTATSIGIDQIVIDKALHLFSPAFGRQEIIEYNGKKIQIFLSKNPTSFNQSLQTINYLGAKTVLLVLNDRIPDGRDVSWIWDTDIPNINNFNQIIISGDRCYDMGLRVKYDIQNTKFEIIENLENAIKKSLSEVKDNETLFILPTYSAMLDARKILTGKKIL